MYAKTTTALAVAVGLCAIQPAAAADMATKAPIMRAPLVAAYNWTGCYIGGNAGGVWGTSNIDIPSDSESDAVRRGTATIVFLIRSGKSYLVRHRSIRAIPRWSSECGRALSQIDRPAPGGR